jgi:hypothetical protein
VLHLADLIEIRFHESEERTEVSALAKSFLVSLHGVPLDPNREVVCLLDALADLVADAVFRGVEMVRRALVCRKAPRLRASPTAKWAMSAEPR